MAVLALAVFTQLANYPHFRLESYQHAQFERQEDPGDPHAPMSVGRKKSETKAKRKSLNKKYGEIRKAKKVSLNCQATKIVMNSGSQFSELLSVSQMSQVTGIVFVIM